MSLSQFFKKNKLVRQNTQYAVTESLMDEKGKPLKWEIKAISTKQAEAIRDACTKDVPVPGKPNMFRPKLDTKKYLGKLLTASVVYPDLYNAELQDSYGVTTPEELLVEMVDDPKEYNSFVEFVQNYNGFESMKTKVDEVKN